MIYTEQTEAVERLREWIKPGDTIYTVLRHVSRSGMMRVIDTLGIKVEDGQPRIYSYGWNVAKALDLRYEREREGVKVSGTGMDMGFHLVYELGQVLFPEGFECTGDNCPSNDHVNGMPIIAGVYHNSGGYALKHKWL